MNSQICPSVCLYDIPKYVLTCDFKKKITICCVSLKGLNALQNLEELNLADNNIEKIGRFYFFKNPLYVL